MAESRASGDGREDSAKMTMTVYTVSRTGAVSPQRAEVVVPRDYVPEPEAMNTQFPKCGCSIHRGAGTR